MAISWIEIAIGLLKIFNFIIGEKIQNK